MSEESGALLCADVAGRMLEQSLEDARRSLKAKTVADEEVHAARKSLKRARAALRLLRDTIGEDAYRRENAALRDAGQHLSAVRDAKITLEAFDDLLDRRPDERHAAAAVELRRALEDDLLCARHALRRPSKALDAAAALLDRRTRSIEVPPGTGDARALQDALKRIYRKARGAMEVAHKEQTAEAFHEWRKQVKYLLNALDGLEACLQPHAKRTVQRAKKLADGLGEDHDLVVLGARVPPSAAGAGAMAASIAARRRRLRKRAVKQGGRLFERKPGRFVERMVGS